MDSMRGLRGSLPLASAPRKDLLQPFRETACALTTLYKAASAEVDRAYAQGAKESLETLLSEMDRENLGLQEGEGWRVRQLIIQLYQGLQSPESAETPPKDERSEDISSKRNSSPPQEHASSQSSSVRGAHSRSPSEDDGTKVNLTISPVSQNNTTNTPIAHPIFSFTTPYTAPTFGHVTDLHSTTVPQMYPASNINSDAPLPPEAIAKSNSKVNGKNKVPLGTGAGAKRRLSPSIRESTKRARHNGSES